MKTEKEMLPEVTIRGILDMQVCVPESFTDEQVKDFADGANICGTSGGWFIREKEKEDPNYQTRVKCLEREGFVHIMLDA